jgi:hypothetical protein
LRLATTRQTPFLRYANAVLPQMMIKARFGEFAASLRGASVALDPRWQARHLVTTTLPAVGRVRCNRVLMKPLAAAMRDLTRHGWGKLIHSNAGCFAGSTIGTADVVTGLSRHDWGAAIDLNADTNPYGQPPRQDPRLIQVMRAHGFTWGGQWLIPDGMHFEWGGSRR